MWKCGEAMINKRKKEVRRSTKVIKRKEYLDYSERPIWVQAKKSTHYIHLTEPEIIAESVNNMKGEV